MEKMRIADFCKAENTYSQLIQELFLHIRLKNLYLTLMMDRARKGDVYQSVAYRQTYEMLKEKVPNFEKATVGEALQYVTEECFLGGNRNEYQDEEMLKEGYQIIKALLVDLFEPYARRNNSTYRSVLKKLRDAACAAG